MKLSSTWLLIVRVFSLGGDSIPYQRAQVNTTISGTPCQRWDSRTPHWHQAEYGGLDGNVCRSDKDSPCPWCYTVDPDLRYDYCFDCSPETIGYNGTVNVTASGTACQMWDSQEPHRITCNTPYKRPHSGLEQNFCRTPDEDPCPWCYTMDPETRWGYCFICDNDPVKSKTAVPVHEAFLCASLDGKISTHWQFT